ncbi:Hamartin protein-domain-containing protein [Tricladium varicosporioides]|nr:Hamartin protein-domain-containing protein [Hymenoscyphus varicosporioides]
MSSGSLKDLTKAISAFFDSKPSNPLPLPDSLIEIINAYLAEHAAHDESDSQRLQENLLNIHQLFVNEKATRLAPFLAILRLLKSGIRGSSRLLQWWDKLCLPVLSRLGDEKGLASEARAALLATLNYDEDDEDVEDAKTTSKVMSERLLEIWLAELKSADEDMNQHARFVEHQLLDILVAFGKKRPKDLMFLIDKFFVERKSRIPALSLLGEFFRNRPPHVHQMLNTPLFENLLKCLQIDTSTRVISMALTSLVMFLPNIPVSTSNHLPALFNIYSRMLFWDRERKKHEDAHAITADYDEKSEKSEKQSNADNEKRWSKMSFLLESEDNVVPELLNYFTILYGLYPLNFMSYIRKPQRYLRHANFPGADDLDIEPTEIRQRSDRYREVHLLHPNFFSTTLESEIPDNRNRWMKSQADDVFAECMALNTLYEHDQLPTRRNTDRVDPNLDIPEHPILALDSTIKHQSRNNSWRSTKPVAAPQTDDQGGSSLQRNFSQTSHQIGNADSPTLHPTDRVDSPDSPTIPPSLLTSPSHNQLSELAKVQGSVRGSIYQNLNNESVASLALSNNHHEGSVHMDAYLMSLAREPVARSPSLRPTNAEADVKIAYLQREIQLLRNDVNFERYLKGQHSSHIGQLRQRQMKEARVEAETQNLINSNRNLNSKLANEKNKITRMRIETEKSKAHARKWEADITAKLKVLREEQKKWTIEGAELKRDLEKAKERTEKLKQLVIYSEAQKLASEQKFQIAEASMNELDDLRKEKAVLMLQIRDYEVGEEERKAAMETAETAKAEARHLREELLSHEEDLQNLDKKYERQTEDLYERLEQTSTAHLDIVRKGITNEMVQRALEAKQARLTQMEKAHEYLNKRFHQLQIENCDLREWKEREIQRQKNAGGGFVDQPLLGDSDDEDMPIGTYQRNIRSAFDDRHDGSVRSPRTDLGTSPRTPSTQYTGAFSHSSKPSQGHSQNRLNTAGSSTSNPDGGERHSLDAHGKPIPKIKPESDVRVFGRGGVQNIGKKEKEKKEKSKSDKGLMGMKSYRGFV